MKFMRKLSLIHSTINKLYFREGNQTFHSTSLLRNDKNFADKPGWLKKFKVNQAAMQRNDGVPVYLKKGLPDKILYNISLLGVIGGWFYSMYIIYELAKK